jgi:serine/threonine protein kinase/Flp pilus assembly protein TadD
VETSVNQPVSDIHLQPLERLRLECEFQLIADHKEQALAYYDQILANSPSPYLLVARAKLLEVLEKYPEAVENFEQALHMSSSNAEKLEILRLILNLASSSSLLKALAEKAAGSVAGEEPATGIMTPPGEACNDTNPTILESTAAEKTAYVRSEKRSGLEHEWPFAVPATAHNEPRPADDIFAKTFIVAEKPAACDKTEEVPVYAPATVRPAIESPQTIEVGSYFVRYKILKQLGKGGMGVVYQALDTGMDRIVALKVIHGEFASHATYAQRFLQEVKATAQLRHPNIVAIYDFGDSPRHYFTMEYIEGQTLNTRIQEGILKCKRAAEILKAVAEAIAVAHQAKVVHRDLKPSNIMLDKNGNAKVMDFGLAKFMEGDSNLSRSGDIIGTPAYMSPEQAAGGVVDARSDIYAIGAVGYEMITGRQMFQGDSVLQILSQVANIDPIAPRTLNWHVESDLQTIILKCLEKLPAKRYQTAQELVDDIVRYLENRPILAKPPTLVAQMGKWVKRNIGLAVAIATVMLSIITAFAYMAYRWHSEAGDNHALIMLHNMTRWNKREVSFETVEREFEKISRLSSSFIIYQMWAHFSYDYARIYPEQRDFYYELAMHNFQKAVEINPGDYISHYFLYLTNKSMGNFQEAQQHLDHVWNTVNGLDEENEFRYAGYGIKKTLEAQKEPDQRRQLHSAAISDFTKALSYNQNLFCVYNLRAELWLEQHAYVLAEKDLQRSLELNPMHKEAVENMARLYLYRGSEELACGNKTSAREYFAKSHDMFSKLTEICRKFHLPASALHYYRQSYLYLLENDIKNAKDYLRCAWENGISRRQIVAESKFIVCACKYQPALQKNWRTWVWKK